MSNSLLFNNLHYNKIIKKNIVEEHPHKNIFINVFILLLFVIILGLFLSYRYKSKQNIENEINMNEINKENEEKNNDLIKNEINIEKKIHLSDNKSTENEKQLLLDIQNNNFGNNLDTEDEQYHLI
jgi:septal ring-binding cell division protein DamX